MRNKIIVPFLIDKAMLDLITLRHGTCTNGEKGVMYKVAFIDVATVTL